MSRENWSSRSLGSRFKHEVFYALIHHIGPWAAYPLLYLVVLYYTLWPSVRRRSRPYFRRRFPGTGFLAAWRHAFRLNLSFALVLLERAVMGLTGRMTFQDLADTEKIMRGLLAEGRGLIILTAHVGAWQTGLGFLNRIAPINIVQHRQGVDVDRHYFEYDRQAGAPKIIDAGEPAAALAAVTSALLAGEIVCVMGDRVRAEESLVVAAPFLGDDILLPGVPFYLAAKVGAPLAVIFTCRLGPLRVAGEVYRVIRPAGDASALRDPESLKPLAEQFAACLGDYVKKHPYQFFNFYDLWTTGEKRNNDPGYQN
jgi:predicted LPLAT superfamily acyltransferase